MNKQTIDSIISPDIQICQPERGFRFGTDSVLLAWFATVKKGDSVIDIGSGSGIISVLLAKLKDVKEIVSVELQKEMYDCLEKTIELNDLSKVITSVNLDINNYKPKKKFNLAVCNPPYRPQGIGKESAEEFEHRARFESSLNTKTLLKFCKSYLNYGGKVVLSGDADRLAEVIYLCKESKFEPKRVQFLFPDMVKPAKIFLLECTYGGGVELKIEPPIGHDSYLNILQGKWS